MKTINLNGFELEIRSLTGTVSDFNERVETHVHGSGGGGQIHAGHGHLNDVKIQSSTSVHKDIFLADSSGQLHPVQLQNWNLPFTRGHKLTVAWVIKRGEDYGPYVVVHNHSSNQVEWNDKALYRYCRLQTAKCLMWGTALLGIPGMLIWGAPGLFVGAIAGAIAGFYFHATSINATALNNLRSEITNNASA